MENIVQANEILRKNRENFNVELKMFINKKLYEKNIISEDAYLNAKDFLIKQAVWLFEKTEERRDFYGYIFNQATTKRWK